MRVGIVGCGLIGTRRARVALASGDKVTIVADVAADRAESVAAIAESAWTTSWEEVVSRDDLDVVVVSTSNDLLAQVSIAALESGKPRSVRETCWPKRRGGLGDRRRRRLRRQALEGRIQPPTSSGDRAGTTACAPGIHRPGLCHPGAIRARRTGGLREGVACRSGAIGRRRTPRPGSSYRRSCSLVHRRDRPGAGPDGHLSLADPARRGQCLRASPGPRWGHRLFPHQLDSVEEHLPNSKSSAPTATFASTAWAARTAPSDCLSPGGTRTRRRPPRRSRRSKAQTCPGTRNGRSSPSRSARTGNQLETAGTAWRPLGSWTLSTPPPRLGRCGGPRVKAMLLTCWAWHSPLSAYSRSAEVHGSCGRPRSAGPQYRVATRQRHTRSRGQPAPSLRRRGRGSWRWIQARSPGGVFS